MTQNGVRTYHVQGLELVMFRRINHLQEAHARFVRKRAPLVVKFRPAGEGDVSRKKVGTKAHVGSAAGIGIVSQADKFCAPDYRAQPH